MTPLFGNIIRFFSSSRQPASKRQSRTQRLRIEICEVRIVPSTVVHDPAYDNGWYQPLNGDTSYNITGQIGTDYAQNEYAFYASAGNTITASATVSATNLVSFDGRLIVFGPSGDVHESYTFINNQTSVTFTALTSGIYLIRLENDYSFPSIVNYNMNVSGADKPNLVVTSPSSSSTNPNTFYISATPSMPKVQAILTGIIPDDKYGTSFNWGTSVTFDASQAPNGPDRPISYTYPLQYTNGISLLPNVSSFSPNFGSVIRGGALSVSVLATIDGFSFSLTNKQAVIGGTNPILASALAYVDTISPNGYNTVLRQLVVHESNGHGQFKAPYGQTGLNPIFSSDGRGGVGFMQITNPAPTDEQVWDWKANIQAGVTLFKQKLSTAAGYPNQVANSAGFQALVNHYNSIQQKEGEPQIKISVPQFTQVELTRDAIRGYNGYGSAGDGFGHPQHEYRVEVDANGNLIINPTGTSTGEVIWQEVPISARRNTQVPKYVNIVLATSPNG